jgi:hypothetical protein
MSNPQKSDLEDAAATQATKIIKAKFKNVKTTVITKLITTPKPEGKKAPKVKKSSDKLKTFFFSQSPKF